jgi:hypothetical protein
MKKTASRKKPRRFAAVRGGKVVIQSPFGKPSVSKKAIAAAVRKAKAERQGQAK